MPKTFIEKKIEAIKQDRMFRLFDEAIKNYWKIADGAEDFLKGFGYRPPGIKPPELGDVLAFYLRQSIGEAVVEMVKAARKTQASQPLVSKVKELGVEVNPEVIEGGEAVDEPKRDEKGFRKLAAMLWCVAKTCGDDYAIGKIAQALLDTDRKAREEKRDKGVKASLNCFCEKPEPDGDWAVGEHEGRYQRCKKCDRRIWN